MASTASSYPLHQPTPPPSFDPWQQNIRFFGPDGTTEIAVPLPDIDAFFSENMAVCLNSGVQMGAALIVLIVLLLLTPASKLKRTSALLQITALVMCLTRASLIAASYWLPNNSLYVFWSGDMGPVSRADLVDVTVADLFSLMLVLAIEATLMHQAWTMVSLWPARIRFAILTASGVVILVTAAFRITFEVYLNKINLDINSKGSAPFCIMEASLITHVFSICWFCAIFNAKLLHHHLLTNRGILPSANTLSSMEILVITNGLLMIISVVFAGLEWAHIPNFEPASLALASVALILPIGNLVAQRVTTRSPSGTVNCFPASDGSSGAAIIADVSSTTMSSSAPSARFLGKRSVVGLQQGGCLLSQCERGVAKPPSVDTIDLELRRIDSESRVKDRLTAKIANDQSMSG